MKMVRLNWWCNDVFNRMSESDNPGYIWNLYKCLIMGNKNLTIWESELFHKLAKLKLVELYDGIYNTYSPSDIWELRQEIK